MDAAKPDVRRLGFIALGAALLSIVLSVTYFYSPFALVVAVAALVFGGVSRSDPVTRRMGSAAILLAVIAIAVSCAMIVWI